MSALLDNMYWLYSEGEIKPDITYKSNYLRFSNGKEIISSEYYGYSYSKNGEVDYSYEFDENFKYI